MEHAELVDDLDVLGECAVHLLEQVPRTESRAAERALRRVGRIVERIATTAQGAAQYAQDAVAAVRARRDGGAG